jgi:AcrR family transcriptional regulator
MSPEAPGVRADRAIDRKDQRRQETVDRVLQAARELLATDGEEALTLRKLAAKTGLSPNTIYAHFGKQRAGIVGAVIADALMDIGDVDDQELDLFEPGRTPWEAAVEQFLSHPDLYRSVTLLRSPERPFKRERRNLIKLGRGALQLLSEAVNDGVLKRGTDPEFLGDHLSLLFRGIADRWARHEIDADAFRSHVLYAVYSALYVNATASGRKRCERLLRGEPVRSRRKHTQG